MTNGKWQMAIGNWQKVKDKRYKVNGKRQLAIGKRIKGRWKIRKLFKIPDREKS
jgi:hypothetical protein